MKLVRWSLLCLALTAVAASAPAICAQESGKAVYDQLKKFELSGGSASVSNLVLKRDRGEMTFTTGTFYFEAPVAGKVRSAVFLGQGSFRAEVPPSAFEKEHVQRMLKADVVESDFWTAVLRFTDETFDVIGKGATPGSASPEAQKLAQEFEPRLLKETGANVSARLAISILNNEQPGFFVAQFDKGRRNRFTFLLDPQGRIPTSSFGINGGEKGLIFAYRGVFVGNDVWMAFYSEADYSKGIVNYSDVFDLVDTSHFEMEVDLRNPGKEMSVQARLDLRMLRGGIGAVPFALGEGLPEYLPGYDSLRLKKNMRVKSATLADGKQLAAVQEDWEGGLTLFFPAPVAAGERMSVTIQLAGDFLLHSEEVGPGFVGNRMWSITGCYYPWINGEWYPRHGFLRRSTFAITYLHRKGMKVAGTGLRIREEALDNEDVATTTWEISKPVSFVTFALGPFERHEDVLTDRGLNVPIEFNSLSGLVLPIKEDFIVAEMMNSVNYLSAIFGDYAYPRLSGVFHPFGFGQGFATLILIPNTDRASKYTYAFIAHETAHQWWGNVVAWRSYRDQWLSEGFAEYSGVLYTGLRDKPKAALELLEEMRRSLKYPPGTETGIGEGRLVDVGPIILGHRLSSRKTFGAYQTLIYNKGGLVLRMLHFLFTDPASGNGDAFFKMMADFVKRHQGGSATTEGFIQVANEHFVGTPIAQKYKLQDLNWFFRQWVYQAHLPSYRLEYSLQGQPDGSVMVQGTVHQENTPADWFMPLPLVFEFDKKQRASGTIHAYGPKTPFQIKLPMKPKKVELDPALWIISEKTSTSGK